MKQNPCHVVIRQHLLLLNKNLLFDSTNMTIYVLSGENNGCALAKVNCVCWIIVFSHLSLLNVPVEWNYI